jgi:threonine dehydrogenase-like Zn-dependent dehydrogenase
MKDTYPQAISLKLSGDIDFELIMTHRFDLEHALEAFQLVDQYKDNVIKAFIHP